MEDQHAPSFPVPPASGGGNNRHRIYRQPVCALSERTGFGRLSRFSCSAFFCLQKLENVIKSEGSYYVSSLWNFVEFYGTADSCYYEQHFHNSEDHGAFLVPDGSGLS